MQPFSLPYPPSANRLWRNVGGKTLKSAAYRRWLEEARTAVYCQRIERVSGPYVLSIIARRPDRRLRDLDNLAKPTNDLLKAAGLIEDDHLCHTLMLAWSDLPPAKPGELTLHLRRAHSAGAA